jgi:transposase
VAIDMWEPYINSVRANLTNPDNKIVFDRYHVMRYLTTALDSVRKREHRALSAAGDTRLARSKYLWLYSAENLPERHAQRFAALRAIDLKTGRAWAIKENLRRLWTYQRRGWAERHWRRWYFWATHSRLPPVIDAAHALKRHQPGLLSYFEQGRTSRPPSTSTPDDYTSTPQQSATELPDEPQNRT